MCDIDKLHDVNFAYSSNFQTIEAVDRGSETKLQVSEKKLFNTLDSN